MARIHVIECEAAMSLDVRRVLERAGFAVTAAGDAGRAAPECPDLVIADPAAVSVSAIRRRYPHARVLAITGTALAAGDAALLGGSLARPFTPSQLLGAVRRCLARPAATTG